MDVLFGHGTDAEASSSLIQSPELIHVLAHCQAWVLTLAKSHVLVIKQSKSKLFDNYELICTNRVAKVKPDKMIWLLSANFPNETSQVLKLQVVMWALMNLTCLVRDMLATQEILCIVEELSKIGRKISEPLRFPHLLPSTTPEEKSNGSIGSLKLDHLSSKLQQVVRQMFSKHHYTWNGYLGNIN